MAAEPRGRPEESRELGFAEESAYAGRVARDEAAVRWSPVFAGVLIALGINIVMYALGTAIALSAASPGQTNLASDILRSLGIWSAIGWVVALFVGGFLAGRLGIATGLRRGILQGSVVWAIYLLVWLSIVSSGLFGALGAAASAAPALPGGPGGAAGAVPTPDTGQILNTAASTAWWLLTAMVVGWVAAAVGGHLGVRSSKSQRRVAGERT